MWFLCVVSAFAGPPIGQVAVGLWPLQAPAWQFSHEDLDTSRYPEPTVLAALALDSERRTHWQFGVQADLFDRRWTWNGAPFDRVTALRIEAQVGARTDLGSPARDRTDAWLEYGGGWAMVPARTPEHRLVTGHAPALHLNVGVARGLGALRPFLLVEGRTGLGGSTGIASCAPSPEPCYSVLRFTAGPGVGLVVGLTH